MFAIMNGFVDYRLSSPEGDDDSTVYTEGLF